MISSIIIGYILLALGVGIERFTDQRDAAHKISHCLIEAGKAALFWPYELQRVIRDK